jgi:ankyrin repeat protein
MKRLLLTIIATLVFVGCTPSLHRAVRDGDADKVKKLLDAGADVDVRESSKDRLQYTPLHWAANNGDLEIAKILIFRGANLDAEDPTYSTPLYLAAEQGHPKVVEFLISKGAEVNVKSNAWGYTPLHRAAWGPVAMRKHLGGRTVGEAELNENYLEIVGILLKKGAKVNARDNDGKTALDQANSSDNGETAALLRKHGGKTGEELKVVEPTSSGKFKEYNLRPAKSGFREGCPVIELI